MKLLHPHQRQPQSLAWAEDFARFYEQNHLSVFRYCMALCAGNQAEAEDITAEAFLRAWGKRGQFSGSHQAALGWVIAIARNLFIDQRRAESGRQDAAILDETTPDPLHGPEAILIDEEQIEQVLASIQKLPLPQREMLTLRYVLGWSVKDVALHLGLAENSVSVNLRRVLAKLQTELSPGPPPFKIQGQEGRSR